MAILDLESIGLVSPNHFSASSRVVVSDWSEGSQKMARTTAKLFGSLLGVVSAASLATSVIAPCVGQEQKARQIAGVEMTRMGAYRALARLTYQAFQKGDNVTAAELATILNRTWDQGEWHNQTDGPDGSWCKANHAACKGIDLAMDLFLRPVVRYNTEPVDPAAVKSAYHNYLLALKKADE
jgi:hypothetical protein